MSVLLLTLAGPLQSWGSSSRFVRRTTEQAPTKSGVLGLLAAAQGLRRTDSIEDLAKLRFGVRVDQPGRLVRDFQTARSLDGKSTMPLSYRFYLADAVFLAAVEGGDDFIEGLAESLRRPTFPLYLGRRSCPPSGPLIPRVLGGTVEDVLAAAPWAAQQWYRDSPAMRGVGSVSLEAILDAPEGEPGDMTLRDQPISFDPGRREYGWRPVCYRWADLASGELRQTRVDEHDPLEAW